ncbi:MAG: hypothetical protein JW793_12675 [Acidobacteria bacterium]|nr:hypothetical protein [Acidobacteriota bacterium]
MTLKQDTLEGLASVDFDCLKKISLKSIPRYILLLLDGTHVISGSGKIISNNGEGTLYLEKALLDGSRLPNFLIEEAVEAVCKSQKLSFNPLQPTLLPYSIKKVTVHPGYIMVYQ